jgi:hypothetical protein
VTIDRLVGIDAKVDRAEQHLRHLDSEIAAWGSKQQPYTAKHDADTRKITSGEVTWITRLEIADPPPVFSIVFGEAVHNMRSALDHLVCHLIERESRQPTNSTAFPIFHTRGRWQSRVERRQRWYQIWRKTGGGPLGGFSRDSPAWALIERHQPYKRGKQAKDHPLFQLEDLWNRDKHRTLNPILWYFGIDGTDFLKKITWTPPVEPVFAKCPFKAGDIAKSGTTLFVARFRIPMPKVEVKGTLPLQPAFGDGEGKGNVFDTLGYVRQVIAEAKLL